MKQSKNLSVLYEIKQIEVLDSVSVLQDIVCGEDVFRIIVFDPFQALVLPIFRLFAVQDGISHLHVRVVLIAAAEDKVAFHFAYSANADMVPLTLCVNEHHILQNRSVVDPIVGVQGEVERGIGKIVLFLSHQGLFRFQIKSTAFIQDLGVQQGLNIRVQCFARDPYPVFFKRLFDVRQTGRRSEIVDNERGNAVKRRFVPDLHASPDIFLEDLIDDTDDVGALILAVGILQRAGKPSVEDILIQLFNLLG